MTLWICYEIMVNRKDRKLAQEAVFASALLVAGERLGAEDEKPESSKPKIELKPTLVSFGSGKYNPKDGSWSSPLNITKFKLSMDPGDLQIGFESNETYDKIGFGAIHPK